MIGSGALNAYAASLSAALDACSADVDAASSVVSHRAYCVGSVRAVEGVTFLSSAPRVESSRSLDVARLAAGTAASVHRENFESQAFYVDCLMPDFFYFQGNDLPLSFGPGINPENRGLCGI